MSYAGQIWTDEEEQRAILLLQDKTFAEVAGELKRTENAVKHKFIAIMSRNPNSELMEKHKITSADLEERRSREKKKKVPKDTRSQCINTLSRAHELIQQSMQLQFQASQMLTKEVNRMTKSLTQ